MNKATFSLSVLALVTVAMDAGHAQTNDDVGQLNPEEMTLNRIIEDAENGVTSMTNCAAGYYITKSGRHTAARAVFSACANDGYTGAMTWMSQLEDNGLGAPENPDAAAEWDRMAAESGDPVGLYNYGLDLMRGRGVAQDEALGRQYVDQAAEWDLPVAQRLRDSGYDLDTVTPDADNWKYAPVF
ncbi:MAG: tetratricopeptide repeat protein [Paracoccaceae bacterium]